MGFKAYTYPQGGSLLTGHSSEASSNGGCERKDFVYAIGHYFWSQLAGIVVSLVSFPIIARTLSVEAYGILSLCNALMLFAIAIAKLGLQNFIIRYFAEYRSRQELPMFLRTFCLAGFAGGLLSVIPCVLIMGALLPVGFRSVAWPVAIVVLVQTVYSHLSMFLRSEEKPGVFSLLSVGVRIGSTFGALALLMILGRKVDGVFWGNIPAYVAAILLLLVRFRQPITAPGAFFSATLVHKALVFGLPLVVFELSSVILAFADRIQISHFMGARDLGVYAAGYTVCMVVADLIRQPVALAAAPMYSRVYVESGEDAARELITEQLALVMAVSLPVFAGFLAIRRDLLVLLASEKYAEAASIMPWVLGGILLYSLQPLLSAGLYLKGRTSIVAGVSIVCGLLNILANMVLLPRFGIIAAGWTTAACYALALLLTSLFSARLFPLSWPWGRIGLYGFCAAGMGWLVMILPQGTGLFWRVSCGVAIYSIAVLALDKSLRSRVGAHASG